MSLLTGIFFQVILFLILRNYNSYFPVAVAFVVATILILWKRVFVLLKGAEVEPALWMCLILIACIHLSVLILSYPQAVEPYLKVNQDILWHIGNVVSLARFTDAESMVSAGIPFRYHYLNDLLAAITTTITHLSPKIVFTVFQPVFFLFFLGISFFCCARTVFKMNTKWSLLSLAFLLFTSCLSLKTAFDVRGGLFLNVLIYHLFTNASSVSSMISFTLVLICLSNLTTEQPRKFSLLLIFVASFLTTFSKAPIGLLFVLGLITATGLECFLSKKMNYFFLGQVLVSLLGFLTAYFMFIHQDYGKAGLSLSFAYTVVSSGFYKIIKHHYLLSPILLIPIHFAGVVPSLFLPFGMRTYDELKNVRIMPPAVKTVYAMIVGGLAATYILMQPGNSQIYFLLMAIPLMVLFSIEGIKCLYRKNKFFFIVELLLVFVSLVSGIYTYKRFWKQALSTLELIKESMRHPTEMRGCKLGGMSVEEFEGYQWLKSHSNAEDIFLSNRQDLIKGDGRYFYGTSISERRSFLEGYSYSIISQRPNLLDYRTDLVDSIFYSSFPIDVEKLKLNGIQFLIVDRCSSKKSLRPLTDFRQTLKSVYHNDLVEIFKI